MVADKFCPVPIGGFRVFHHRLIGFIYLYLGRFYLFIWNVIVSHQFQCRIYRPMSKITAWILLDMGSRRNYGRGFSQFTSHAAKVSTPLASELVTKAPRRLKYVAISAHPFRCVLPTFNRPKSGNS